MFNCDLKYSFCMQTYQTNDAMSGAPKSTLDYSVVDSKAEKTVITMSDKKFGMPEMFYKNRFQRRL